MENRRFNTKALVEASILSVITAIFIWLNLSVPFFFLILPIIIPIPLIIVYVRYDYKVAILSIIISSILLTLFGRPVEAIIEIISGMLPALTLGYCIKKNKPAISTILYATLAGIAATIITTVLYAVVLTPEGIQGITKTINEQIEYMKNIFVETKNTYQGKGFGDREVEILNQIIDQINIGFFLSAIPGTLAIITFVTSALTYIFTQKILLRLKIKINKLRPLSTLYINNRVGAVMIVLLCAGLLLDLYGITIGRYIASFIFITGTFSLLLTGSSLMAYFLSGKLKFPKSIVIVIIIFTGIQFFPFYFGLGLTDMIIDFRKLDPNRIFKR